MKKVKIWVKMCLSKGKIYIYIYIKDRFVDKTHVKNK